MRGQASLEFMIISAAFLAFLVIALQPVQVLLSGSKTVASKENARSVLKLCVQKCTETRISGSESRIVVRSLDDGILRTEGHKLVYKTGNFNMTVSPFRCSVNSRISRGENLIIVRAPDSKVN